MTINIDIFESKSMLRAMEQRKPVRTPIKDRFFTKAGYTSSTPAPGTSVAPGPNEDFITTEKAIIEVMRHSEVLAPVVSNKMAGKVVETEGRQALEVQIPTLKPKTVTTAASLLVERMPGESLWQGYENKAGNYSQANIAKASIQLGKDLKKLDDMCYRYEEWQCSQAIQTGIVPVQGEGISYTIDFLMLPSHKITLTTTQKWDAPSTCKPLATLRKAGALIADDAGLGATDIIFGSNAYQLFLDSQDVRGNANTKGLFDMISMTMGLIDPTQLPNGLLYLGRINELGADVWVHSGKYFDADKGESTPYIDPNNVVVLSNQADFRFVYGPIADFDANLQTYKRFPKVWTDKDPSVQYLLMQSSPLAVPAQIDGVVCIKVA
jgi:hypothetical protein